MKKSNVCYALAMILVLALLLSLSISVPQVTVYPSSSGWEKTVTYNLENPPSIDTSYSFVNILGSISPVSVDNIFLNYTGTGDIQANNEDVDIAIDGSYPGGSFNDVFHGDFSKDCDPYISYESLDITSEISNIADFTIGFDGDEYVDRRCPLGNADHSLKTKILLTIIYTPCASDIYDDLRTYSGLNYICDDDDSWEACDSSNELSNSEHGYCTTSGGTWEHCSSGDSVSSDSRAFCPSTGGNWDLCNQDEKLSSNSDFICTAAGSTWLNCTSPGTTGVGDRAVCRTDGDWNLCSATAEKEHSDKFHCSSSGSTWQECGTAKKISSSDSGYSYCNGANQWIDCTSTQTNSADGYAYCQTSNLWTLCDGSNKRSSDAYAFCNTPGGTWEHCTVTGVSANNKGYCFSTSGEWDVCGDESKELTTDSTHYCAGVGNSWVECISEETSSDDGAFCDTSKWNLCNSTNAGRQGTSNNFYCGGDGQTWEECDTTKITTSDNTYYCAGDSSTWQNCGSSRRFENSQLVVNYYYCDEYGSVWQRCDDWKISSSDSGRGYCPANGASWVDCSTEGLSGDSKAYCPGPGNYWRLCDGKKVIDSATINDYYYCSASGIALNPCDGTKQDGNAYCIDSDNSWNLCDQMNELVDSSKWYCPASGSDWEYCSATNSRSSNGKAFCPSSGSAWEICDNTEASANNKAFCSQNGDTWDRCGTEISYGTISSDDNAFYCDSTSQIWEKCDISDTVSSDGSMYCALAGGSWEECTTPDTLSSDDYAHCDGSDWNLCDTNDETEGSYKCKSSISWKLNNDEPCAQNSQCYSGKCDSTDSYGGTDSNKCITCTGAKDGVKCEQLCGADAACDEYSGCVGGVGYCDTSTCELVANQGTGANCYDCDEACTSNFCGTGDVCAVQSGADCTASDQCESGYFCSSLQTCINSGTVGNTCTYDLNSFPTTGSICRTSTNYECCHQICIVQSGDDDCDAESMCSLNQGNTCFHPDNQNPGACCGSQCILDTDLKSLGESCTLDCQCGNNLGCDGTCKYTCTTSACPCDQADDCMSGLCDYTTGHCVASSSVGSRCYTNTGFGVICEPSGQSCCGETCVDRTSLPDLCGSESSQCNNLLGTTCYDGSTGDVGSCCGTGATWSCITAAEERGFGQSCNVDCECGSSLKCDGICKYDTGGSCDEKDDCYSDLCSYSSSQCVASGTTGTRCRYTTTTTGAICNTIGDSLCCNEVCIAAGGGDICSSENTCEDHTGVTCYEASGTSGSCCADQCITSSEKKNVGKACTETCECKANMQCSGGRCKYYDGQSCDEGDDCISGICSKSSNTCVAQSSVTRGDTCYDDSKASGVVCLTGETKTCCSDVCIEPPTGYDVCGIESTCDTPTYQSQDCFEGGTGLDGTCCAADCQTGSRKTAGQSCTYNCECDTGLECKNGECKAVSGQDCSSADECTTPACVEKSGVYKCDSCNIETQLFNCLSGDGQQVGVCCGGECLFSLLSDDSTCTQSCECQSGVCSVSRGYKCKLADGVSCSKEIICDNTDCVDQKCGTCGSDTSGSHTCTITVNPGQPNEATYEGVCCFGCLHDYFRKDVNVECLADCQCKTTMSCYGGLCKLNNDQPCTGGIQCKSGICVAGICKTCAGVAEETPCKTASIADGLCCSGQCKDIKSLNEACSSSCECGSGLTCSLGGSCKLDTGQTCSKASDCNSGYCVHNGEQYVCSTCNLNTGKSCKDSAGDIKTCCVGECGSPAKIEGESCDDTCECGANMQCFGTTKYCRYEAGETCTSGVQCVSTYCLDTSGLGDYQCGTCSASDYGHIVYDVDDVSAVAICCTTGYCDRQCVDTDGNDLVDACTTCSGVSDGNTCQSTEGSGKCCNNQCIVNKKGNGQTCGKDCECAGGYCDLTTQKCSDLAGSGSACIKDADCQPGLSCIDSDGNGAIDSCFTCTNYGSKKCQEGTLNGYCCGDTCSEMLVGTWSPASACGASPCDGAVTCQAGDVWKCATAGQNKCKGSKSSTCSDTGTFNDGTAQDCSPYSCNTESGLCYATCTLGEHCISGNDCVDVSPEDGAPETCTQCSQSYEGHDCKSSEAGYCCGDNCQTLPGEGWTPSSACGSGACTGTVVCEELDEEKQWVCDSVSDPVCSLDVKSAGECGVTGEISNELSCGAYLCNLDSGVCKNTCASSADCQNYPCIDSTGDGTPEVCGSCVAFQDAFCNFESTDGYCCGTGCAATPDTEWTPAAVCGTDGTRCGDGTVVCKSNSWRCDTEDTTVCSGDGLSASYCNIKGIYDTGQESSCGTYECQLQTGECYAQCLSDTHCSSDCCVATTETCVAAETVDAGGTCEKDCQCSSGLTCDPGTHTCSQAFTCPGGHYQNCPGHLSVCVEDPLKGFLCKQECSPDHAPCDTAAGAGFCCAGQCIKTPTGYEPEDECGGADCLGEIQCNLDRGDFVCSSYTEKCCVENSNNKGSCDTLGSCIDSGESCSSSCSDNVFYGTTCVAGECESVADNCDELSLYCDNIAGCVECIGNNQCDKECTNYFYYNYTCEQNKCQLTELGIVDCSQSGTNQICAISSETGCDDCTNTEQCQENYESNYACDAETKACKVADCFTDEHCGYSCENRVFKGYKCENYVCVEQEPTDCKRDSLICSSQGCVDCTNDYNCTLTYGDEFSCQDGTCQKLCGNNQCDASEDCQSCAKDCACTKGFTCDPTSEYDQGCAPDKDGDSIPDHIDPCPKDANNQCKPCQSDDDCIDLCQQNQHLDFSCQGNVCTPGEKTECVSDGKICDSKKKCILCSTLSEPDKECAASFSELYICFEDKCVSDKDFDGIPDDDDPCPTDNKNACAAECGNDVCESTEDCSTCPEDCSCDDTNDCTKDKCITGKCLYELNPCGTNCGEGGASVCSPDGECVSHRDDGETCECEGMCRPGTICTQDKICLETQCGDGICENECNICPQDCTPEECKGNGRCDTLMRENCLTHRSDCKCPEGRACDINGLFSSEVLDTFNCYEITCGDEICDRPIETSATCCIDCGCIEGECDKESNKCIGGCGDGICEAEEECKDEDPCRKDCKLEDCMDEYCSLNFGETCQNSPDCLCNVTIDLISSQSISFVEKDKEISSFLIVNTGNINQKFDIFIETQQGLDLNWKERPNIAIDVESTQQLQLEMTSISPGNYNVDIIAVPKEAPNSTAKKTITVTVKKEAIIEKITILANIKDLFEIILLVGTLLFAIKKRITKEPLEEDDEEWEESEEEMPSQVNAPSQQYNQQVANYYAPAAGAWQTAPTHQGPVYTQAQVRQLIQQQKALEEKKREEERAAENTFGLHPGAKRGIHPDKRPSKAKQPEPEEENLDDDDMADRGFHP